jgi:hypothetical protein
MPSVGGLAACAITGNHNSCIRLENDLMSYTRQFLFFENQWVRGVISPCGITFPVLRNFAAAQHGADFAM